MRHSSPQFCYLTMLHSPPLKKTSMKGLTGISCKGKLTLKIAKNKVIIGVPYLNLSFAMTPDTDCRVPRLHVEQSQGSPAAASAFRRQPNPPRVDDHLTRPQSQLVEKRHRGMVVTSCIATVSFEVTWWFHSCFILAFELFLHGPPVEGCKLGFEVRECETTPNIL